ncbi:ankyrin repeat-containing domain protein [Aspergillus germanicus]
MSESAMPQLHFDIQHVILATVARAAPREMNRSTWKGIVDLLCVCKIWHASFQTLLIQNMPAYAPLRICNSCRGVGLAAVQRAVAEYISRRRDLADYTSAGNADSAVEAKEEAAAPRSTYPWTNDSNTLLLEVHYCMDTAAGRGYLDILRLCFDAGVEYKGRWLLRSAILGDQLGTVKFLLDGGYANLNEKMDGTTMLGFAVEKERPAIVDLFLSQGAKSNIRVSPRSTHLSIPISLVSYAAYKGNLELLKVLLKHGLPLEGEEGDDGGRRRHRPIMWAVAARNVEMVEMFIENGVNLRPTLVGGDWPLEVAVSHGNIDMVALLLEHGGLPEHPRVLDRLYREARRHRSVELQQLLRRGGAV